MGELAVQVVGFVYIFLEVIVVVVLQLVAAHLQQVNDVFRYIGKLTFWMVSSGLKLLSICSRHGSQRRPHTIYQFAGKVIYPGSSKVLFEHRIVVQAAHGKRTGTFHLFNQLFLELHGTHCPAQSAQVFVKGKR